MAQDFYQTFASIDKSLESIAQTVFEPTMVKAQERFIQTGGARKAATMQGTFGTSSGNAIYSELNTILTNTDENTKEGNEKVLAALNKQITVLENIDSKESKADAEKLRELVTLTNENLSKIKAKDRDKQVREAGSISKTLFAFSEARREGKGLKDAAKSGYKRALGFGEDEEVDPKEAKRRAAGMLGRGLLHTAGAAYSAPGMNLGALFLGKKEEERRSAMKQAQQEKETEATRTAGKLAEIEGYGEESGGKKGKIGFQPAGEKSQRIKDFETFDEQSEEKQGELIKGLYKEGINVDLTKENWTNNVIKILEDIEKNTKKTSIESDKAEDIAKAQFADDQSDEMEDKLRRKEKAAQEKIQKVETPGGIDTKSLMEAMAEGKDGGGFFSNMLGNMLGNKLGKGGLTSLLGMGGGGGGAAAGGGGLLSTIGSALTSGTGLAAMAAVGGAGAAGYQLYDKWDSLTGEGGMSEEEAAASEKKFNEGIFAKESMKKKGITNTDELNEYNKLAKEQMAGGAEVKGKTLEELRGMKKPEAKTKAEKPGGKRLGDMTMAELAQTDVAKYHEVQDYKQERIKHYLKDVEGRPTRGDRGRAELLAKRDVGKKYGDEIIAPKSTNVEPAGGITGKEGEAATAAPVRDIANGAKAGFDNSTAADIASSDAKAKAAEGEKLVAIVGGGGGNQQAPASTLKKPEETMPVVKTGDDSFVSVLFGLY